MPMRRTLRIFFAPGNPRARRGGQGSLSGAYDRKTPFAIMELQSGNCITKNKRPHLRTPRHQLDEEKSGDRIAMLGKDDAPFQGGGEEKDPSWTGGEGQAYAEARPSMRLRGCCCILWLCPHMQNPRLCRGFIISLRFTSTAPVPERSASGSVCQRSDTMQSPLQTRAGKCVQRIPFAVVDAPR